MKLRTFFSAFFLVLVWFAGANMALGFLLADAQRKTAQLHRQMDDLTSLSEDLVISSQWQTRFARGYIATRDPARLRFYTEIDDILSKFWSFASSDDFRKPFTLREKVAPVEFVFLGTRPVLVQR